MSKNIQALLDQAWTLRTQGDMAKCRSLLRKAEKLSNPYDHETQGRIQHIHAQLASDQGNKSETIEHRKATLDHYEKSQNSLQIAHAARHLADSLSEMDQLNEAIFHYHNSLDFYRKEGSNQNLNLANTLRGFAILLEKLGILRESYQNWEEAKNIYSQLEIPAGVEEAQENMSRLKA